MICPGKGHGQHGGAFLACCFCGEKRRSGAQEKKRQQATSDRGLLLSAQGHRDEAPPPRSRSAHRHNVHFWPPPSPSIPAATTVDGVAEASPEQHNGEGVHGPHISHAAA
jgi:hypothetical protein